jgi:hypothetical protein
MDVGQSPVAIAALNSAMIQTLSRAVVARVHLHNPLWRSVIRSRAGGSATKLRSITSASWSAPLGGAVARRSESCRDGPGRAPRVDLFDSVFGRIRMRCDPLNEAPVLKALQRCAAASVPRKVLEPVGRNKKPQAEGGGLRLGPQGASIFRAECSAGVNR